MKQQEIGNKLNQLRNQKGLTQKELSEQCGIDIRTIQRIESGEVSPRMSTLKLIAKILEFDFTILNEWNSPAEDSQRQQILLFSCIMGIIYLGNMLLSMYFLQFNDAKITSGSSLFTSIINMVAGVSFYHGFFILGTSKKNQLLKIPAIIVMIVLPLLVLSQLVMGSTSFQAATHFIQLFVILLGINGIAFGIGLLKSKGQFKALYTGAGILQILISPMFIIPVAVIQLIGFWLAVPFTSLLILVLLSEYRNT